MNQKSNTPKYEVNQEAVELLVDALTEKTQERGRLFDGIKLIGQMCELIKADQIEHYTEIAFMLAITGSELMDDHTATKKLIYQIERALADVKSGKYRVIVKDNEITITDKDENEEPTQAEGFNQDDGTVVHFDTEKSRDKEHPAE